MSDKLIELASEVGAQVGRKQSALGNEPYCFITGDQLSTFAARIRAEALEEAAQIADEHARKWSLLMNETPLIELAAAIRRAAEGGR